MSIVNTETIHRGDKKVLRGSACGVAGSHAFVRVRDSQNIQLKSNLEYHENKYASGRESSLASATGKRRAEKDVPNKQKKKLGMVPKRKKKGSKRSPKSNGCGCG
jgi:hypothetical protein